MSERGTALLDRASLAAIKSSRVLTRCSSWWAAACRKGKEVTVFLLRPAHPLQLLRRLQPNVLVVLLFLFTSADTLLQAQRGSHSARLHDLAGVCNIVQAGSHEVCES